MRLLTFLTGTLAGALLPGCLQQDCAESLCGCWEAATLEFEATLYNPQLAAPVEGAEVYCDDESEPLATSDADGLVSFSVETELSPGCGYARCDELRIDATDQGLQEQVLSVYEANGERIDLQYMPD